ncbi:hypothetical protein GF337_09525 [candidate division KSB1 bacterium]|nr:hypothetical protein [candidate division KSB1 bacterium]
MGKRRFIMNGGICFLFFTLLISLIVFGCAKKKPELNVSQYRFSYEEEFYRVRSITSEDNGEKYNELIGEDFIATDYDQDGYIDYISMGEATVEHAQNIYVFGLDKLRKDDKLNIRTPTTQKYQHEEEKIVFEIISFRSANMQPFNQFKIIDKRQVVSPRITIFKDLDADGNLDELMKGEYSMDEAQSWYSKLIEKGLDEEELVRTENMILVKPNNS